MEYNYEKFDSTEYDFSGSKGLQIGDTVPDLTSFSSNGDIVPLLKKTDAITVLETGSITCPLYSGNIDPMNKLAKDYPEIDFKILYIREAHPGKKIPSHKNIQEKIKLAHTVRTYLPENREIIIDDINGTVHKVLGLLPNTVLVIGQDRKILYRIDWNHVPTLSKVLKNIEEGRAINNIIPKFKPSSIPMTLSVLLRAGSDALFDFLKYLPHMIWQRSKKNF